MRKIRIAQIGINKHSHGSQIFKTLKENPDVFDVAGYAIVENEREESLERLGCFEGYPELSLEEILNDESIEAVTVETDEIHLTKYARLAAEHGKHIHMEKPGSQNLCEFEEMIDAVRKGGKTFHTGSMYRYNPYVKKILRDIESGELGEVHSVEAQMDCILAADAREWLSTFKGGMMFYLGCHLIDLVYRIQGEPESIKVLNKSTGNEGVFSEDFALAVFEYKNGCSIIKSDAAEVGGYARRQLTVTGSKKTVELKPFEMNVGGTNVATRRTEYTETKWTDCGATEESRFDRYADMMLTFAKIVRGEMKNPYTLDYELALYKLILKCCGM